MQCLRRHEFANIANFRDLGGYPIESLKMTRWGVFFRSTHLANATPNEIERIYALGVRTVIDLRIEEEIQNLPDALMHDPRFTWHHLSLLPKVSLAEMTQSAAQVGMPEMYKYMVTRGAEGFNRLFSLLAEGIERGAVLFHCFAGKDRTGITAMLLMSLAGVDRLDILSHYQISAALIRKFYPEDVSGSDIATMVSLLEFLDAEYGGTVGYLEACGVSEGQLRAIRERFVQPIEG